MLAIAKVPIFPSTKAKLNLPSTADIGIGNFYAPTSKTVGALTIAEHTQVEIPVFWYEGKKTTVQCRLENFTDYSALGGQVREVANRTKRDYIAQVLHGMFPVGASQNSWKSNVAADARLYTIGSGVNIGDGADANMFKQLAYKDILTAGRRLAEELKLDSTDLRNFVLVCSLKCWEGLSSIDDFIRYDSFGRSQWETGFMANLGGCTVIVSNNLPKIKKASASSIDTYTLGANAAENSLLTGGLRDTALLYYAPYMAKTAFNPMLKIDTRDIANSGTSMFGCGGMASGISHGTVTPSRFFIMDNNASG